MAFIFSGHSGALLRTSFAHSGGTQRVQKAHRVRTAVRSRRATWMPHMSTGMGSVAVDFSLPITDGSTLTMKELGAKSPITVIYFYPKDATSGCTVEAGDFRDLLPEFEKLGASVVGVSKDSVESHQAFAKDLGLTFPLIADDGTLCGGYGVMKLKKWGDDEILAIERSTFVIKDGVIVKEWRGVKSGGHAQDVLDAVRQL